MATRKNRFPHETDTAPGAGKPHTERTSGPAPKNKRERSEAPTLPPPPKSKRSKSPPPRSSTVKPKGSRGRDSGGAEVDEVVADLTRDPRREKD